MLKIYFFFKQDPAVELETLQNGKPGSTVPVAHDVQANLESKQVDFKRVIEEEAKKDLEAQEEEMGVKKYNFMKKLCEMVRQGTEKSTQSNDPNFVLTIYNENRSTFVWPKDGREGTEIIEDFFSPANFIKRLQLHLLCLGKGKAKHFKLSQYFHYL